MGVFINIDGPCGVGKGTLIKKLIETWDIEKHGKLVSFYDPGIVEGHSLNKIREVVKQEDLLPETELLLFHACRVELWGKIHEALSDGLNVILDRGPISTEVYQCKLKGLYELNKKIDEAVPKSPPDISFILTAPFEVITERLEKRFETNNPNSDKFKTDMEFRKRVWLEYQKLSLDNLSSNSDIIGIDASGTVEDSLEDIYHFLDKKIFSK